MIALVRDFFLKLVAFIAILLTIQVVVSAMHPPVLPEEILELDQQLQAGVDIVYFGDSTLIYPEGEPTIPEILRGLSQNELPTDGTLLWKQLYLRQDLLYEL